MKPESTIARLLRSLTGGHVQAPVEEIDSAEAAVDEVAIEPSAAVVSAELHANLQGEFDKFRADSELVVEALEQKLQAVELEREKLKAEVADVFAELASAKAEVAKMVKIAADAKLASRAKALADILGDEKAGAVLAAVGSLPDQEFSAVLDAFASAASAEAKTKMFNEQGVSAESDGTAPDAAPSKEMQILKAKYGQKA